VKINNLEVGMQQ